ncbi:tetratricopeptide repeat protein [Viscerimonas tarda]
MKNFILTGFLFLLLAPLTVFSQSLNEAKELYKTGEFEKALPVFEKEYVAKPTDPSINQWYGVCLYETNTNLKKAEECIAFAASKSIPDAFLYLGKIYTETYRFDKAEIEFEKYAKLKKRDKAASAQVEKEKGVLAFMKRAALHTEDIQIIDSIVVDKSAFLSAYKLSPSSGYLDYYATFFNEGASESTVYSNEKSTKIYYAKPAVEDKIELFSMEKLLNDFGNEKKLSDNNFGLSGNLNYPFVLTDGVTVYFSAEDKNGLGGYDMYVTRYNMNNDTYLTPERLNMPFNSLFNDYMMAMDEEKGVGWFASDRFQPEDKVCIYTFIPNEQVAMLEGDDENQLVSRAIISSIKDSWKPDVDYSKIVALARKEIKKEKEILKDFTLVINDKYTYFNWTDFKNPSAKDLFWQATESAKNLGAVEARLDVLRDVYASQPSQATANEILELENKQRQLFQQAKELEIKARNQEITSLN